MPPLKGQSNDVNTPAVTGDNTASGLGVFGDSGSGTGVSGHSITAAAVAGESDRGSGVSALGHGTAPALESVNDNATADAGPGLRARSAAAGIIGESTTWMGVFGLTQSSTGGNGVMGQAVGTGAGVFGESSDGIGVLGQTSGPNTSAAGVRGVATNTDGACAAVVGENQGLGPGVLGTAGRDAGVTGFHGDPRLQETTVGSEGAKAGVFGASDVGAGLLGYARSQSAAGVVAFGGITASAMGRPFAGEFFGNVQVHGDVFLAGQDCAEQFDLAGEEEAEAGDVVVISPSGGIRRSVLPYDRAVAGVVSGAGSFRPGIMLGGDRRAARRRPIALVGKVFCKVDARSGAVRVGDLLTSSGTPGHAMVASDQARAFGAVLGKALGSLHGEVGLLPILVCLQ
jgi:hypothetical protein